MFDNQNTQTTSETNKEDQQNLQPQNSSSSFDTMLSEIRNDRGEPKYRTVEDGLNALKHSQEHIRNLTQEKTKLEDEVNSLRQKVAEIEELRESVKKLTQRSTEPAQQAPQFNEEALASLVDSRLSQRQQEELMLANQRSVASELSRVYGDKAKDAFYEKAKQLGLPGNELEALAAKSPKAVLTMFNIGSEGAHKQPTQSPTQGRVNTEHFQGKPSSFIGSETEQIPLGGGVQHYQRILDNSNKMVDELREQGLSIDDLTNPANYFKYFKKQG